VRAIWRAFCAKNRPTPDFDAKTLNERLKMADSYYTKFFVGNLCFLEENGFAIFGNGQKWLDEPVDCLKDEKTAVLIMGANVGKRSGQQTLSILLGIFHQLMSDYSVVAWNQNRVFRQKSFERLMKFLSPQKIKNTYIWSTKNLNIA